MQLPINTLPIYRGSELYSCKRHLAAIRLSLKRELAPVWLQDFADDGKSWEGIIKDRLRKEGWIIEDGTCSACTYDDGSPRNGIHGEISDSSLPFIIICHADGKAQHPKYGSEVLGLEVKTKGRFEFDRWMSDGFKAFPTEANQATVEMVALGVGKLVYPVKNRDGRLDRTFVDNPMTRPPADIKTILSTLTEVEDFAAEIADNHIPPEDIPSHLPESWDSYNPQSYECRRCPYIKMLGCVKEPELSKVDEAGLNQAEKDWLLAQELKDKAEELEKNARGIFIASTIAQDRMEQAWKWNNLNILYHTVRASSYTVNRKEHGECRITRLKEKNNGNS